MGPRIFIETVVFLVAHFVISVEASSHFDSETPNITNCSQVFTSLGCANSDKVFLVHESHHAPVGVVSKDSRLCDVTTAMTSWSMSDWTTAISDVIQYLKWKDVLLVIDDSLCPAYQRALRTALALHHIGTVTLQINDPGDSTMSLAVEAIQATTIRSGLLCLSSEAADAFFTETEKSGSGLVGYKWVVVCPFSQPVNTVSSLPDDIVVLSPVEAQSADSEFSLDSLRCGDHYNRTEALVPSTVTCQNSSALHPCSDIISCTCICIINNTSGNLTRSTGFLLSRVEGTASVFEYIGNWTRDDGLQLIDTENIFLASVFHHFHGKTLRIGAWDGPPFLRRLPSNDTVRYEGLCIDMINEIAYLLNFTYEIVEPPDEQYGAPDENGTWNGMVAMLMRGETDMAIGPFTITSVREDVIDFTVPFMEDGGGILTKGGKIGQDMYMVFRPLPYEMWLYLGVAVFVTGTVLYVVKRFGEKHMEKTDKFEDAEWTLPESYLYAFGSLMQQGAPRHPRSSAGRVVLGCWWLFTILIVSIYTATLAAILTVTIDTDAINSIDDLAQSSLDPVTLSGTSWHTMFTADTNQSDVFSKVGARMAQAPVMTNEQKILDLVYRGQAAYIMDVSSVDYLYRQDCRNLHMAKHVFSVNGLGFALPQGARYKDAVNRIILQLQESGVMDVWKRKWWRTNTNCGPQGPSVSNVRRLDVVRMSGLFILYAAVVAMSCLAQLVQMVLKSKKIGQIVGKCRTRSEAVTNSVT